MEPSVRNAILLAASLSVLSGCEEKQTTATPNKEVTQQLSSRVQALEQIPGWVELKKVWQELDAIAPKDSTNFGGPYMGTLSLEAAQQYRKRVKSIRYQLGAQDKGTTLSSFRSAGIADANRDSLAQNREKRLRTISDLEVDLLCDLMEYRIDMFQHGPRSLFTRMVYDPASPLIRNERSTQALEKQIDLILSLKEQKKMSSDEYTLALQGVQQQIYDFAITNIIREEYRWSTSPFYGTPTKATQNGLDAQIAELDAHYNHLEKIHEGGKASPADEKTYKGYKTKYRNTKEKLKELKETLPALHELIVELQR